MFAAFRSLADLEPIMRTDVEESSRKRPSWELSSTTDCPEQWRIDVNNKYQNAVGVVISLATGAMLLPILFLKEIVKDEKRSLAHLLNLWAYTGWILLALSILSGILYHYCSAKWVKLSWHHPTDIFGKEVSQGLVETCLDVTYFVMMAGFVLGLGSMVFFMVRFVHVD